MWLEIVLLLWMVVLGLRVACRCGESREGKWARRGVAESRQCCCLHCCCRMSWAWNSRATWQYGKPYGLGEVEVEEEAEKEKEEVVVGSKAGRGR